MSVGTWKPGRASALVQLGVAGSAAAAAVVVDAAVDLFDFCPYCDVLRASRDDQIA